MADWYFEIESMTIDSSGHLYGTLCNTGKVQNKRLEEVRIIRNVTVKDLRHPDFDGYSEGDVTVRFHNREELMNAIVEQWEAVADAGDRLFSFHDWYRDTGVTLKEMSDA